MRPAKHNKSHHDDRGSTSAIILGAVFIALLFSFWFYLTKPAPGPRREADTRRQERITPGDAHDTDGA